MSFMQRQFDFNNNRINRNLLMDERRIRMHEYNNKITQKNLGFNRPLSNLSNNYRDERNYSNYNSSNIRGNNNRLDIPSYNHDYYERLNKRKEDYLSNKKKYNNNNLLNNNLINQPFSNKNNDIFGKENSRKTSSNIFYDKNGINSKTEKIRGSYNRDIDNLKKIGINNDYIKDYIPDFAKLSSNDYIRDNNFKDKLKQLEELDKEFNKIKEKNNTFIKDFQDINYKNDILSKYITDGDKTKKDSIFDYKDKLSDIKNEDKKNNKIIYDILKRNDTKKTEIEIAKKEDYLDKMDETESISHQRSNKYRASSVAPSKTIIVSEISKITNSLNGFNNLGSTCYMNSALQNIIHCKIFISKIITIKNSNILKSDSITNSFLKLCNSIIDNKNRETSKYLSYISSLNSISPSNFKNNFCYKHREYMRGQHDSIEFLRTLLDDMSKEININQNISAYKELTTEGKSKEEQNKEYHNFFLSRENSIIVDIFYNQMINIFTCACGFESYSFQKLLDIPLLLPNKILSIDLLSLIKDYFKEEELDWSTKCEKCQKEGLKHLKMINFSILNEIVIFSLQRLNPILSIKNKISVKFEEIIDLKDYCDKDLYKENTKYRLCGTINHIGNINYGHYYAHIKIDDIWYEFNDSIVKKVNFMDYDSSSVCVLFYEKI